MSGSKPPLRVVGSGSTSAKPKWLRILIADDDRDTANMLAMVLRDEGHQVQITLRGDDALDICRLFRPDVVIADVNMPGTSGYALAHELRERSGSLAPLMMAVIGVWTPASDGMLGKAAGFDPYLLKPCEPKEVIRLIEPLRSGESQKGQFSG